MDAMAGRPPLDCAVCLTMTAFMPIPTSGLRKAERALAEQELRPHAKRPDMTQLLKRPRTPSRRWSGSTTPGSPSTACARSIRSGRASRSRSGRSPTPGNLLPKVPPAPAGTNARRAGSEQDYDYLFQVRKELWLKVKRCGLSKQGSDRRDHKPGRSCRLGQYPDRRGPLGGCYDQLLAEQPAPELAQAGAEGAMPSMWRRPGSC